MTTSLSNAPVDGRSVSFVIPPDISTPHFTFNQRVRVKSTCQSQSIRGIVGTVKGLEYMDLAVALAQGMSAEDEGWSCTFRLDDDDPKFPLFPIMLIHEEDLETTPIPS